VARSAPDSSLVGKLIDDRYELLEVIGDGGVGVVYRARRVKLERMLAVKVLHEALVADDGFVRRFQREAVAMSRLYHPHCVAVSDFGVYESRPYLVLEYVPGATIRKLLEGGRFEPARAVHVALQLLETLAYFHGHHVIHRDLKSENVMLTESSGTRDFVKVLDFGMAKILTGPGADSQLSKIGIVPGTPSAMAPEQIGQLPPDPRIDIYATGILLYEMIVGERPFSGSDMAAVIKMQLTTKPRPPREILGAGALSAELEQVVIRALEKDRVDRYGTAEEMVAALRLTPEGRTITAALSEYTPRSPVPEPARRSRWPLRAGLLVALALAGALLAQRAPQDLWQRWQAMLPSAQPAPSAAAPALPNPAPAKPTALPAPPPPPPPPLPVVETWIAHRDLAATYTTRGQHEDAFREVQAAIGESPRAASADPALVAAAVNALDAERVAFVVDAFRDNPELVDALADATSNGTRPELRRAAHASLRLLGEESRADLVALQILEVEQASKCAAMRAAFKQLRAFDDPRADAFARELRKRGRNDRHVRCLRRALRR
jgi:eukaryotic-like serine/threonine-protein kinase